MSSKEKIRISLIISSIFFCLCLPSFFAKPADWINIIIILLGIAVPVVLGGLLLRNHKKLQTPYVKFFFTWILSGFTIFFVSSLVLISANYPLQEALTTSSKLGLLALAISLLLYLISLALKKALSGMKN